MIHKPAAGQITEPGKFLITKQEPEVGRIISAHKMGPGGQMGCDSLALRFQRGWPSPYSQLFGRSLRGPIDAMLAILQRIGKPRSMDSGHICRRTTARVNHLARSRKEPVGVGLVREIAEVVDLGLIPHGGERISS